MKKKIIICDDNPNIAVSLHGYFAEDGFEVLTAACGSECMELLEKEEPVLIILDVMLPDVNGLDLCMEIRKESNVPILMLSAKGEVIDRILGLQTGADDYVAKPFSPHEVLIRAKKLMQRSDGVTKKKRKLEIGELVCYPDNFEVYIGGSPVKLSAKEFKTLCYMVAHEGQVITREHILNAVWGYEYAGEMRMVDTVITRLRKKIFQDPSKKLGFDITTVFGVGYKLEEKPD